MNKFVITCIILLPSMAWAHSPADSCKGEYKALFQQGDTVVMGCEDMVVMNADTYTDYWYSKEQLIKLRDKVPEWQLTIDSISTMNEGIKDSLEAQIKQHRDIITLSSETREDLENTIKKRDASVARFKKKLWWAKLSAKVLLSFVVIGSLLLLILV